MDCENTCCCKKKKSARIVSQISVEKFETQTLVLILQVAKKKKRLIKSEVPVNERTALDPEYQNITHRLHFSYVTWGRAADGLHMLIRGGRRT